MLDKKPEMKKVQKVYLVLQGESLQEAFSQLEKVVESIDEKRAQHRVVDGYKMFGYSLEIAEVPLIEEKEEKPKKKTAKKKTSKKKTKKDKE